MRTSILLLFLAVAARAQGLSEAPPIVPPDTTYRGTILLYHPKSQDELKRLEMIAEECAKRTDRELRLPPETTYYQWLKMKSGDSTFVKVSPESLADEFTIPDSVMLLVPGPDTTLMYVFDLDEIGAWTFVFNFGGESDTIKGRALRQLFLDRRRK